MSHPLPKKNVGILTLPLDHNYGGILQCIALQEILQQLGCETLLLDRRAKISPIKKMIKNLLFGHAFTQIETFKRNHIRKSSQPIYSTESFKHLVFQNQLNAIIVGSDQVWRQRFVIDAYLDYFLHFLKDTAITKLAYAASFGSTTITSTQYSAEISEALKTFRAISVREDTAKSILSETFAIDGVKLTLDPTLLLPRTFYETLTKKQLDAVPSENYLFAYLLDKKPSTLAGANSASVMLNLPLKIVDGQINGYLNRLFKKKVSVENWLNHFLQASFVVTDSYHGMLFSIIFEKQFIILVNEKRGAARFESLARLLGLEDRLVNAQGHITDSSRYTNTINYELVYSRLAVLKEESIAFLKENLK